jgi:alkylation response protein AidB-like acyl-CoA dehydrogenase
MLAGHPSTLTGKSSTVPRGVAVDFTFDAEQLALQDVARRAMDDIGGDDVRRLADDPVGFDTRHWARLVDLGWTDMLRPGSGAGLLETSIVLEQMGRVPLPGPFFSSCVYATLAARALGADELLEGLASGGQRGTVALHEQGNGHPLGTVRARARRKGAGWVVSGTKPIVVDGHTADWAIVVALAEDGVRSFLLPSPRAEAVPNLDPTRKLARLVLDDEPVEPLGPVGDQTQLWRGVLDDVAVALSAELVGVSHRALDEAVEYAKERVVFDRPIATFQSVKHRIVDMYHALEMARVGVHFAAWASDTDAPERSRTAAMAAGYASEAAVRLTGDDIQVHGGVGFTWANDAHFLFKRAKQNQVLMGGSGHQWHQVAAELIGA